MSILPILTISLIHWENVLVERGGERVNCTRTKTSNELFFWTTALYTSFLLLLEVCITTSGRKVVGKASRLAPTLAFTLEKTNFLARESNEDFIRQYIITFKMLFKPSSTIWITCKIKWRYAIDIHLYRLHMISQTLSSPQPPFSTFSPIQPHFISFHSTTFSPIHPPTRTHFMVLLQAFRRFSIKRRYFLLGDEGLERAAAARGMGQALRKNGAANASLENNLANCDVGNSGSIFPCFPFSARPCISLVPVLRHSNKKRRGLCSLLAFVLITEAREREPECPWRREAYKTEELIHSPRARQSVKSAVHLVNVTSRLPYKLRNRHTNRRGRHKNRHDRPGIQTGETGIKTGENMWRLEKPFRFHTEMTMAIRKTTHSTHKTHLVRRTAHGEIADGPRGFFLCLEFPLKR